MLIFRDVTVMLGKEPILDRVSFTLRPHRMTALIGRNGSGKSTLLSCVNQQTPYTGQILDGEKNLALIPYRERAKSIGILPQSLPAPHILAREMVSFGRNPYLDFTGRLADEDKQAIDRAMQDSSVEELADRYVDTLSGGERQRVALAMLLAQNTPIALLDEPTAHMDKNHETAFLRQLTQLKKTRKKTFLVVLHDITTAMEFADDLLVLDGGRLIFSGSREECLEQKVIEEHFGLTRYTFDDGRIFFTAK